METTVIVVGAGPTGLMLGCELGLAGVPTVLVDAEPERSGLSRAGGVTPRTAEVLDLRGLLEPLIDEAGMPGPDEGHFADLPVSAEPLDSRYPWLLIPQLAMEEFLERRLTELGVPLLRGHTLTALDQDEDGVTAYLDGPTRRLRGRYLVGADGGHSATRKLAGIGFPGTASTAQSVVSDVMLADPVPDTVPSAIGSFGSHVRQRGEHWSLLLPFGGVHRLVFGGPEQQELARDAPITEAETTAALAATYGPDVVVAKVLHGSRFGNAYRLAERYRAGRVFLAGDAAHIHPPMGGQGLNLGVQDAMNLGWKLAAVARGDAVDDLLDSYHVERHPVAASVLHNIRAQSALARAPMDEEIAALHDIVSDLAAQPGADRFLAGLMSGVDIRYPVPDAPPHSLLGKRLPDLDLEGGRAYELFHDGTGVLLDGTGELGVVAEPWAGRVRVHRTGIDLPAPALLVRPDGCVCWAGVDAESLGRALDRWFGALNLNDSRKELNWNLSR
ncbi:MAG TPA: FAD-dependent monooxygenase [Pseudonocardiaceae bacterium]|jgi:2-polyprenyl-6-methoxyphenol hydroxylase-like FAD-dependent oxidoreductase